MVDDTLNINSMTEADLATMIAGTGEDVIGNEEEVIAELTQEQAMIDKEFPDLYAERTPEEIDQLTKTKEIREVDAEGNPIHSLQLKHSPLYSLDEQAMIDSLDTTFVDPEFVKEFVHDPNEDDNLLPHVINSYNSIYGSVKSITDTIATRNWETDPEFDAFKASKEWEERNKTSLTPEEAGYLIGANNADNFRVKLNRLASLKESQEVMAKRGTADNLLYGMLGTVVDVDMLLPLASVNKAMKMSKNATKLVNTLKGATAGAVSGAAANVAAGVALAETNPYYKESDIIADFAMGTALGGTLGALAGHLHTPYTTMDNVLVQEDGSLVYKPEVDEAIDGIRELYGRFDDQTEHSNLSAAPTVGEDVLARARAVEATRKPSDVSIKEDATITPEGTTKAPEEAVIDSETTKLTESEQNVLEYSSKWNNEDIHKLKDADFKLFVNVKGISAKAQVDTLPTKRELKAAKDALPKKVESLPRVKASEDLINTINTRLNKLYNNKDVVQPTVTKLTFTGDKATSITTVNKFGQETTFKGDDAEVMAGRVKQLMYIDADASMSKMLPENRIAYQKDIDTIYNSLSDKGTNFKRLLDNGHSLAATSLTHTLIETATGDNTIGGMSAVRLTEGYVASYSHGFEMVKEAINDRATEIAKQSTYMKVLKKLNVEIADTKHHAKAQKELSNLISDLHLQKGVEMQKLRADLDIILDKYKDAGGNLVARTDIAKEANAIAAKYNQPAATIRAVIGSALSTRKQLYSWQKPVVSAPDVLPVLGTKDLEPDYHQPQMMNHDVFNKWLKQGVKRGSYDNIFEQDLNKRVDGTLVEAVYNGYYEGLRHKNPGMDDLEMRKQAAVVADAVVGRAISIADANTTSFAAKDTTGFINDYFQRNPNLNDATKALVTDVLEGLQNEKATASFLKNRVPFDRTKKVSLKLGDGTTRSFDAGDFMVSPTPYHMVTQMSRSAGVAALASKGINSEAQLLAIKRVMKKELDGSGIDPKQGEKINLIYDSMLARIKAEPAPLSAISGDDFVAIMNTVKAAFSSAALNGLVFAQIGEFAQVGAGVSLRTNMHNMGITKWFDKSSKMELEQTLQDLKTLTMDQDIIAFFESPTRIAMEETGVGTIHEKADKFFEVTQSFQRQFFGHQLMMSKQRQIAWLNSLANAVTTLDKSNWTITDKLRQKGWTEDGIRILKRELDAGRMFRSKSGAVSLNYKGIMNIGEVMPFEDTVILTSMLRGIEKSQQLLRPLAGQDFVAMTDPKMAVMTHLQSYTISTFNNTLLRQLRNKDREGLTLILTSAFASTMAAYIKAYVEGKDEDLEFQHAMFKYNSLLAVPGMGMDAIADALDMSDLRVTPDYDMSGSYNVPLLSYLGKIMSLPEALVNMVTLQGLTSQDVRTMKATLPLFNNPFSARFINMYIDSLKDKEKQVRAEKRRMEQETITNMPSAEKAQRTLDKLEARPEEAASELETLTSLR